MFLKLLTTLLNDLFFFEQAKMTPLAQGMQSEPPTKIQCQVTGASTTHSK